MWGIVVLWLNFNLGFLFLVGDCLMLSCCSLLLFGMLLPPPLLLPLLLLMLLSSSPNNPNRSSASSAFLFLPATERERRPTPLCLLNHVPKKSKNDDLFYQKGKLLEILPGFHFLPDFISPKFTSSLTQRLVRWQGNTFLIRLSNFRFFVFSPFQSTLFLPSPFSPSLNFEFLSISGEN